MDKLNIIRNYATLDPSRKYLYRVRDWIKDELLGDTGTEATVEMTEDGGVFQSFETVHG